MDSTSLKDIKAELQSMKVEQKLLLEERKEQKPESKSTDMSMDMSPKERSSKETENLRITVILIDGTWKQAKQIVSRNPRILQCRRIFLDSRKESVYGNLRIEPRAFFLSTLESTAEILLCVEEDQDVALKAHESLMSAFQSLVSIQSPFIPERDENNTRPIGVRLKVLVQEALDHFKRIDYPTRHPPKGYGQWVICQSLISQDKNTYLLAVSKPFFASAKEARNICKELSTRWNFCHGDRLCPMKSDSNQVVYDDYH